MGTGLAIEFALTGTVLSVVETISPGLAVPEASTISLVLPDDGGLNGAGPDEPPALSHGLGGGPFAGAPLLESMVGEERAPNSDEAPRYA